MWHGDGLRGGHISKDSYLVNTPFKKKITPPFVVIFILSTIKHFNNGGVWKLLYVPEIVHSLYFKNKKKLFKHEILLDKKADRHKMKSRKKTIQEVDISGKICTRDNTMRCISYI